MKFIIKRSILFTLITLSVTVLAGCQTIRNNNAKSTEQMLAAAGFQMKQAQTPAQLEDIQGMQQRKLVPHVKDGQNMYVYADAEFCHCVYVGAESNYQQYQNMAYQQKLADEQRSTAQMNNEFLLNRDEMMDWDVWGPWGPWR